MDNFHFIKIKPSIERKEVSFVKEAIFKRAREKAQQMNDEQNNQYTSEVKNDIMEIASADFRSNEFNPFNKFKESMGLNTPKVEPAPEPVAETEVKPVEQQTFEIKPLKHNVQSAKNENYADSIKDETMLAARNQFRQDRNLTTSLNFLNAQAAIQMAKYAHSKINYLG